MAWSHSKIDPFMCGMNVMSITCVLLSGLFLYCLTMSFNARVLMTSVHSGYSVVVMFVNDVWEVYGVMDHEYTGGALLVLHAYNDPKMSSMVIHSMYSASSASTDLGFFCVLGLSVMLVGGVVNRW